MLVMNDLQEIRRVLERLVVAQQRGLWDFVNILLLASTLVVVAYYTWETRKLRTASERQVANGILPIVFLNFLIEKQLDPSFSALREVSLENVGYGPAFDVRIAPIQFGDVAFKASPGDAERKASVKLLFDPTPILKTGERQVIKSTVIQDGGKTGMARQEALLLYRVDSGVTQHGSLAVVISYRDANGNDHKAESTIKRVEGNGNVMSVPKSLT